VKGGGGASQGGGGGMLTLDGQVRDDRGDQIWRSIGELGACPYCTYRYSVGLIGKYSIKEYYHSYDKYWLWIGSKMLKINCRIL